MLGKVATQKLRIKDIDTNLRLAKNLQIVSIDYLVEDADVEEIFKSAKKKNLAEVNKIAPIIAGIARGVGMAAQMGAKAVGAAAKAGAKAGKTAAKVGKEAVKTGVNAAQDAVEAGSDVVSHANQTIDQSQPQDGLDQLNKSLDDFLLNKGIIDNAAKRYNEMKDTYSKYNKTHNFPGKAFMESNPETPGARTLSGGMQMGRGAVRLFRAGKKKLAGDKKSSEGKTFDQMKDIGSEETAVTKEPKSTKSNFQAKTADPDKMKSEAKKIRRDAFNNKMEFKEQPKETPKGFASKMNEQFAAKPMTPNQTTIDSFNKPKQTNRKGGFSAGLNERFGYKSNKPMGEDIGIDVVKSKKKLKKH